MKKPEFSRTTAFTLIELLVVMGIIVLMASLVVPAVSGTLKGTALNQAAQTMQGQFNNAQQVALAKGQTIEMRIISCADPDVSTADQTRDDPGVFKVRGIQLYSVSPNMDSTTLATIKQRYTPVTKLEFLPNTIIVDVNPILSTLCDATRLRNFSNQETYQSPKLPRIGTNYKYYYIQFRADGTTDLNPNKSWFLTMHDTSKGDNLNSPPSNFFTLSLDATQGSTRTFRPM